MAGGSSTECGGNKPSAAAAQFFIQILLSQLSRLVADCQWAEPKIQPWPTMSLRQQWRRCLLGMSVEEGCG